MITRRLLIHGRVQGVWYRESLRQEADRLGVTGWVRNLRDGTVEAVVQGEPERIAALLAWARGGPPAARVDRIDQEEAEGQFTQFEKRPTA